MTRAGLFRACMALMALALSTGCVTRAPDYDYSAFIKAKPVTLLVMPPLNESPDIKATPSVWSHATRPLAEAGYYVLPVTLVDETFKQNGVSDAAQAQDIPYEKLREYFGADAAVYLKVTKYGTSYQIVASETRVEIEGRIIDLRSGALLWQGKAFATSAEQGAPTQGGVAGLLLSALVKQIVSTTTDTAYSYGGIASMRLMGAPRRNGVLPGPRSPLHGHLPSQ